MTQGPSELELTACALRAVNLGLLVVDADLRVALWNQWMVDTSGISSEQAIGRTLHEIFPSTRLRRLQRKVDQVLTLGIQGFFDARVTGALLPLRRASPLHGDAALIQQNISISMVCVGSGAPMACVSISDETAAVLADRELRLAHERLEASSRRDALTGLLNRTTVCGLLDDAIRARGRVPLPLSAVLVDLDHFKQINDTWGHLAGDEALRMTGIALQGASRGSDHAGRYGGEEFLVVLPDTDPAGAHAAAERIQERIRRAPVEWREQRIALTASFGVATHRPGETAAQLLSRADDALYQAKEQGRDQICAAA